MLKIAVTGGIGSGKSTVCETFRSRRIPVLSADELSKKIANTDPAVRRKIRTLLGPGMYGTDGRLDRSRVAASVFGHPRLLSRLERILHPVVLRRIRAWFREQQRKGRKIVVVEAALVFESGLDAHVDLVVVVDAPRNVRVERIRKRHGLSRAEIHRRMNAQMSDAERRERADVIVHNDSTQAMLRQKTAFLIDVVRKLV